MFPLISVKYVTVNYDFLKSVNTSTLICPVFSLSTGDNLFFTSNYDKMCCQKQETVNTINLFDPLEVLPQMKAVHKERF